MEREIKFRGMTINGNMVYGNYAHIKKDFSTVSKGHYISNSAGAPFAYLVRPETVGQFTGLVDKNGKEIFHNDIVRILYTDWGSKSDSDTRTLEQYLKDIARIGIVKFNNSSWEVFFKSNKHEYFDAYSSIYPGKHGYIEVIGNIHQNPELLP